MSLLIHVSDAVRRQFGADNIAAMLGDLPRHVQCFGCGRYIVRAGSAGAAGVGHR